jgi:amino acid permease
MKMWKLVTLAIVLLTVSATVITRFTNWIAPETRTVLFTLAPTLTIALLLVLYFKWRATLKNQVLLRTDGVNPRDQHSE